MRALLIFFLLGAFWVESFAADFWEVRIELGAEQRAQLGSAPRQWVPAKVTFGKRPGISARVKLKGRGTFQTLSEKPSFTIEIAPELTEGVPYSSTKIHLNNSADDASYLKEKLGSELFARVGILAARVGHARVTVNDRELGIYVLKEGFDEMFARRELGEGVTIYDEDPEVAGGLDLDVGEDRSGPVKQLWQAATVEPRRRFEELSRFLEVETFARFLAMEVLICHWDGYGLSENNFRIAVMPNGMIRFLPAGMDQIFSVPNLPVAPDFLGKVARGFIETAEGEKLYRESLESLVGDVLDAERLTGRVAEHYAALEHHLTRSERGQIREEANELSERIAARAISVREQLRRPTVERLEFVDGVAVISEWRPMDKTEGVSLKVSDAKLIIVAGAKTSAAFAATVRLPAGAYTFSTAVRTEKVRPLPVGERQGACLRLLGRSAQSDSLVGSTNAVLRCAFELAQAEEVTLLCELRASGGMAEFERAVMVRMESGIPGKKK